MRSPLPSRFSLACLLTASAALASAAETPAPVQSDPAMAPEAPAVAKAGAAKADAAKPEAAKPGALTDLQALIAAQLKTDPTCWTDYDLDHDGKASQVEIVACLAKRPAWIRGRFPTAFAAVDTDRDHAVSFAELTASITQAGSAEYAIEPHAASVKERENLGAPAGVGTSVGVSSGGSHAYVAFMHQQAYIADYDVVGGQYDPVIGILGSGTVLDVSDVRITIHRR